MSSTMASIWPASSAARASSFEAYSRGAVVGPFARLRPGAELAEDARVAAQRIESQLAERQAAVRELRDRLRQQLGLLVFGQLREGILQPLRGRGRLQGAAAQTCLDDGGRPDRGRMEES